MKLYPLLATIMATAILTSCASSKKNVYSPTGSWKYEANGTPNGDSYGTFVLTMVDEMLAGSVISDEYGESRMEQVTWEQGNIFGCNFFMADIDLDMTGTFYGDTFSGTIDAGQYGVFPITATRKVEK